MTARPMTRQSALLTVDAAAEILGVPAKSLQSAAEKHGHLIRVGRAIRIPENELEELVDKCRSREKAQGYTCESAPVVTPSLSSKTLDTQKSAQAQVIADKLKSRSHTTSHGKTGAVVRLRPAQ